MLAKYRSDTEFNTVDAIDAAVDQHFHGQLAWVETLNDNGDCNVY